MKMLAKLVGKLLERKIGLDSTTISDALWTKMIQERMAACEISSEKEYFDYLNQSKKELQELIEVVIVPETWFFREREGIEFLRDHLWKMAKEAKKRTPINILSLPCSSGEEPYSLAMALLERNFPPHLFQIWGVDISKKAIEKAKRGVYGKNSFRDKDLSYREQFFEVVNEDEYLLKEKIREKVYFFHANLFDSNLILTLPMYDAIFFRNLLIYLNKPAQKKAFAIIDRILTSNGFLFVSPAELEIAKKMHFALVLQNNACCLKRKNRGTSEEEQREVKKTFLSAEKLLLEVKKPAVQDLLKEARRLADKGSFEEAKRLCLSFLKYDAVDPECYFLLGLIHHATGKEEEAEVNFLKTVYLNPNHHEALIYLSLLFEKKNDHDKAELYRERAERVQKLMK